MMNTAHRVARQMRSPEAARYGARDGGFGWGHTKKKEVILVRRSCSVCVLSHSRQPWYSRPSWETLRLLPSKPALFVDRLYPSPCVSSLFKVVQFGAFSSHALILKDRPLWIIHASFASFLSAYGAGLLLIVVRVRVWCVCVCVCVCVCLYLRWGGMMGHKGKANECGALASFLFSIVDTPSEDRVTLLLPPLCVYIYSWDWFLRQNNYIILSITRPLLARVRDHGEEGFDFGIILRLTRASLLWNKMEGQGLIIIDIHGSGFFLHFRDVSYFSAVSLGSNIFCPSVCLV